VRKYALVELSWVCYC